MTHSESQRNRYQRGEDFQDEIRRSWPLVPSTWRMRIADAGGGSRPADEITLTPGGNILAEMKRTEKPYFQLSFLRPNQIKGLLHFESVLPNNFGLVYVSFHNEAEGCDLTYAFRLSAALSYMQRRESRNIPLACFMEEQLPAIVLPRLTIDGEPGYDLRRLAECYMYL